MADENATRTTPDLQPKTKLQRLEDRARKANEALQSHRAELAKIERKKDTRRKILAGSLLLTLVESGEWPRDRFQDRMDGFLKRNDDRALFDLPPHQDGGIE